jgi:hypothetical protein
VRAACDAHAADWVSYFDQRLANERAMMVDIVGEALGTVRNQLREEIRQLREALKAATVISLPKRRDIR